MQWDNKYFSLSWNCKELLSCIVITFMTIAGWISNSRYLLSCYLHSRILSSVWTLFGPLSSQQSLSSMEYTAVSSSSWVLWSISASLNHKELVFGPSCMSPEVRHIWEMCHALKNKILDPSSLPRNVFIELQLSSQGAVCPWVGACGRHRYKHT